MKILYVIEYYYPHIGGAEMSFQMIAEGVARSGNMVRVITTLIQGSPRREIINGVEIIRLKMPRRGQRYWFTFLSFFYILKLGRSFDIIHTALYNAAPPAWLAAFILRKKIVLTIFEVWDLLWYKLGSMNHFVALLHRLFEKFVLFLPFSSYIACSEFTRQNFLKLNPKKENTQCIYYGIDYNFFDNKKYSSSKVQQKFKLERKFVYTYFGRPGWAKGVSFLIEAVPLIVQKIPSSRLVLILSRDPESQYVAIQKRIHELHIENSVIFMNSVPRSELPEYLVASSCVIIPSLSEGFGFSIAESCALGIPVVASNAGSIPEVISGRHILFQPGSPKEIAQAITMAHQQKYLDTPAKVFKWDDSIQSHLDIYTRLIS